VLDIFSQFENTWRILQLNNYPTLMYLNMGIFLFQYIYLPVSLSLSLSLWTHHLHTRIGFAVHYIVLVSTLLSQGAEDTYQVQPKYTLCRRMYLFKPYIPLHLFFLFGM
jgi:hypothetical protein